ncbi:unnamed protein product [Urochloa humidicola]
MLPPATGTRRKTPAAMRGGGIPRRGRRCPGRGSRKPRGGEKPRLGQRGSGDVFGRWRLRQHRVSCMRNDEGWDCPALSVECNRQTNKPAERVAKTHLPSSSSCSPPTPPRRPSSSAARGSVRSAPGARALRARRRVQPPRRPSSSASSHGSATSRSPTRYAPTPPPTPRSSGRPPPTANGSSGTSPRSRSLGAGSRRRGRRVASARCCRGCR